MIKHQIKKIGLAPNPHKPETLQLTLEIANWLESRGIQVVVTRDIAEQIGKPGIAAECDEVAGTDLLVVLGGDGTLLMWSRIAVPKGTPIMGINYGRYGFITEIDPEEATQSLERILSGDYCISERVVLKATLLRDGIVVGTYYGLNDVVVSKGPMARMLALHTYVDGKFIVTHFADGIIVSSPTGSTAYSLSAGGPVVHPDVSVLIVTPICPHTLNARPLVVPDDETVCIIGECGNGERDSMLTIDGQLGEHLACNDKVEVSKADFAAKLVLLDPQSFYEKLQTRLHWGERFTT